MSASGGLSEPQKLAVGRALLIELARLHETGQVSGVIGPATVLVDDEGSVRLVEGPVDQAYASPEVLSGQPPTAASDLYSAAALLAHLFRGEPTLPPTAADLDPGVAWLLGPVLTADPVTRPSSAAGMVGALDQLAEQRHGPEWRLSAGLVGAVGAVGAVPVVVLATGGTAAAAGVAGTAGAAGVAGAAGLAGAAGSAGAAGGVAGGVGGAAGAAGAGAAGAAGASGAGAAGGTAALAASAPAGQVAAGGGIAATQGAAGAGQGVVSAGGAQAAGHGSAHAGAAGISKGVALKVGAVVAAGGVGVAGAAAALVLLTGGETKEYKVPATADIYLIGASEETSAALSDPGTKPIKIDVDGAGSVSFPSVKGDVGACDGCEPATPDGSDLSFGSTAVTAFNGIAGVTHANRTLFVVGVFVGEDNPSQAGDAFVDLTDADDEVKQEPELGEPFFIGDGETGDGDLHEIVVPDDATTLYLGFADGYGFVGSPGAYGDNHGTVTIEVTVD